MAVTKILAIRQLPLLNTSICLSASQRNKSKQRTILKKFGFPTKPKRPPNGYFSYIADNRASVMAQNPKMSFTEITQLLCKNWKELPENEKEKYTTEFKKKLQQYKEDVKEYKESLTERQKSEMNEVVMGFKVAEKERDFLNKVKKLEKELNKPRKPVSPFFMFCQKNAEKTKGKPSTIAFKEHSEEWKQLSDSEKEPYREMFNKSIAQYRKDLEKWEEQMIQQGNIDVIRMKTLIQKVEKYV